jgi:mRNA-degrading endonuclease RelE of RelBE toxin-antitoxin system
MALTIEETASLLSASSAELLPRDAIRRQRRVDRAIDESGKVIIDPPDFSRQRSPDGSIWRIKVGNTGVITATKE